jgi:hypothetical protein
MGEYPSAESSFSLAGITGVMRNKRGRIRHPEVAAYLHL